MNEIATQLTMVSMILLTVSCIWLAWMAVKSNELLTSKAYISMSNKCVRLDKMRRDINKENLMLRDKLEEAKKQYDDCYEHCIWVEKSERDYKQYVYELEKNEAIMRDEIIVLNMKLDQAPEQMVKSKLSKADLEMMIKATGKMTLLVNSMPMNDDIQLEMFDQYNQYLADLKHVQESLLIWKNDEFYLLPIKTMSDLVDTIDTIIKKVDIDAPKFTKVLEVARAKIVLALDNKPQNKE